MTLRTFICEPFVSYQTFEKSYKIRIYMNGIMIYDDVNNIWPDDDENDRINFLNMILDLFAQPPLTKEEIFYHKMTEGPITGDAFL